MLTQTEATKRVRRGIKLLDEVRPGWAKKIRLSKFNIEDPKVCVLGQVYGDFVNAITDIPQKLAVKHINEARRELAKKLKPYRIDMNQEEFFFEPRDIELDSDYFGFSLEEGARAQMAHNGEWEILGQTWVRAIRKRQLKKEKK